MERDGNALCAVPNELRADREVVLAAVRADGDALQYASDELVQADREVVLAAVNQRGDLLWYASNELLADVARSSWRR